MSAEPITYANRDEWLASREGNIGASEVACIMGFDPHKSAYKLAAQKIGLMPPDDETIPMRRGHAMEPLAAELYTEATGREVHDPGDFTVWTHPDLPYLRCTPDRLTVPTQDEPARLVELKDIETFAAMKIIKDGHPKLEHQIQLQTQMAVMGFAEGDLACMLCGNQFAVYPCKRNEEFIALILKQVARFHDLIERKELPPVDDTASTLETLKVLHPLDNGETVTLDAEVVEAVEALDRCKGEIRALENLKLYNENVIRAAIGDATFGTSGDMTVSLKTTERKGYLRAPNTAQARDRLEGIDYEITKPSTYRVLRRVKK